MGEKSHGEIFIENLGLHVSVLFLGHFHRAKQIGETVRLVALPFFSSKVILEFLGIVHFPPCV